MNSDKLVEAKSLSYSIDRGKIKLPILSKIDLTFEAGDFLALQGPSGSGKSTLLHLLGTLLRPTGGELRVGGINPFALTDLQLAHFRSHEVGFIFQQFHVFPNLNLLDNILIPTWLPFEEGKHSSAEDLERAKEWAARLGVSSRLDHYPHQLSGGQLQRLVIARALMRRPRILFADEPTGNLDSKNATETLRIFQNLNEEFGQSIFLVTHDPSIAAEASRKLFMVDGKIESDERIRSKSKAHFPTSAIKDNISEAKQATGKSIKDFALQNLKKNFKRSTLTMLGIFVGIACTFFLGSLGTFVQDRVIESYRDMGVSAFRFHAYPNWPQSSSRRSFPYSQLSSTKDMAPLLKIFPEISSYSPIYVNWAGGRLVYGGTAIEESTRIYGVSKDFFDISAWKTSEGKIFSRYQERNSADICLIGSEIKKKLFPNRSAHGEIIEVHLESKASVCRVVGVLEDRKFGSQWDDPNKVLFVPHTSFVNFTSEKPLMMSFLAKVKEGVDTGLVATSVESFFKKKYGSSGEFRADRNSMLLAQMQKFTRLMRVFLLSISLVCLLMGGVGLMNMMLVSVSERLSELGLLQALGASSSSLRKGVVFEALCLCFVAGIAGVIFSFTAFHVLLWTASNFVTQISFQWHFDPISLVFSIVAIFVVAIASAILPARKAAELEIAHTLKGR